MAQSRTKVPKQTEMNMNGNDRDQNQPYGKLKDRWQSRMKGGRD